MILHHVLRPRCTRDHASSADAGLRTVSQQILDQASLPLNFLALGGVSAACALAPVDPGQYYLVGSIPIKARKLVQSSNGAALLLTAHACCYGDGQRPKYCPAAALQTMSRRVFHVRGCFMAGLFPAGGSTGRRPLAAALLQRSSPPCRSACMPMPSWRATLAFGILRGPEQYKPFVHMAAGCLPPRPSNFVLPCMTLPNYSQSLP